MSSTKAKKPKDNPILTYYQKIKDGSIVAGEWIVRLYTLIVKGLEEKSFFYDPKKANAAIDWIETHGFHTEGQLAPGAIKLELWQKAFLACLFGILDENGNRQFREVVLVVAISRSTLQSCRTQKVETAISSLNGSRRSNAISRITSIPILPLHK